MQVADTQLQNLIKVTKVHKENNYEPYSDVLNRRLSVAILELKKWGGNWGAKEKVGGATNVYLAWWFFVVLTIKLLWFTLSNPAQAYEYR